MASKVALTVATLAFLGNILAQSSAIAAQPNTTAKAAKPAAAAAKTPAKTPAKTDAKAADKKAATDKKAAAPAPAKPAPAEDISDLAPVLPPENFFGAAAMGYAAAKANPRVCSKIFCYCGCDITDSHTSLLDCFTGMHGADCHICQEEAMQALRMKKDNSSVGDIQKAIDAEYSSKYPFKDESAALKKYRSARLYTPGTTATAKAPDESGEACCASGAHK